MAVALKLEHGIDNVFQHLGTGNGTFLGDVAYEYDGGTALLGILEQGGCTLAYLGDGAGRGIDIVAGHGLDGIDNEEFGLHVAQVVENLFQTSFAEQEEVVGTVGYAVGTKLDLALTLFATDIEYAATNHAQGGLEQQGRLTDSGLTAYKDKRTGYNATAEHAVEFGVAGGVAGLLLEGYLGEEHGGSLR